MGENTTRRRRKNVREESRKQLGRPTQQTQSFKPRMWIRALCAGFILASAITPILLVLIPSPINPKEYSFPRPPKFEGALEANDLLQQADHIYEDQVLGPESLVVDGEHIYTGTADGQVLDIHKGEVRVLAKLGEEPCGTFESEPTCGRPLGMRLHTDGYLYVVDAYLGLFKINVATGHSQQQLRQWSPVEHLSCIKCIVCDVFPLWPASVPIGGDPIKFLNDLTITSEGMIYMTDSSTRWDRRHNRYLVMEAERTGRLLEYNPKTNETFRVASHMSFPNGIQLSKDEDYLLICETTKAKIHKFHLKGQRKGELEVFMDNLPGLPDNIRRSSSGGYWVGFATVRRREKFSFVDYTASRPWIRKLIAKLFPQDFIMRLIPKYGLIIEISAEGKIVRSFHDPTGQVIPAVSEVEDKNGVLYLGSYSLPYMSRLYLRKGKK